MSEIIVNTPIPILPFTATSGVTQSLGELAGHNVVLYFYPRDNTPGCTQEGLDFSAAYSQFSDLNCKIFGISRDSLKKHENFKAKQGFKFELISDADGTLCELFDVIKQKMLYGKQYIGIERSTFLIDSQGVLRQEWRKVKVSGHVDEVLTAVKEL